LTSELAAPGTLLPANVLQYLGGSTDLRGYGLQELSGRSGIGGLTSGFISFETRLAHTLPLGFEPFIFLDMGAIGKHSMSFSSPIYKSPGAGLRWASPFGTLAATLARGY